MTALLVLEKSKLDDKVTFSKTAVTNLEAGAVKIGLVEGDQVSVKDCLYRLLLKPPMRLQTDLPSMSPAAFPHSQI